MTKTRIVTDVPPIDVPSVVNMIEADGGTAVVEEQRDGRRTVVGTYRAAAPAPGRAESAPRDDEPPWMRVARAELGVAETPGTDSTARIREYFRTTTLGDQPDHVPWCSAFANFCIERAGLEGTKSALARSWMRWGVDAATLTPGCIVVLSRGEPPSGHVGFFAGMDGGRIRLLGGNQGNKVSVAAYDGARLIGRRVPRP